MRAAFQIVAASILSLSMGSIGGALYRDRQHAERDATRIDEKIDLREGKLIEMNVVGKKGEMQRDTFFILPSTSQSFRNAVQPHIKKDTLDVEFLGIFPRL